MRANELADLVNGLAAIRNVRQLSNEKKALQTR